MMNRSPCCRREPFVTRNGSASASSTWPIVEVSKVLSDRRSLDRGGDIAVISQTGCPPLSGSRGPRPFVGSWWGIGPPPPGLRLSGGDETPRSQRTDRRETPSRALRSLLCDTRRTHVRHTVELARTAKIPRRRPPAGRIRRIGYRRVRDRHLGKAYACGRFECGRRSRREVRPQGRAK